MRLLVVALAGVSIALVVTPLAMAVARRADIVDHPGPLKPQARAVPYLGGVAVFVAAIPGMALAKPLVVAPLAGALILGVLDDRAAVPPALRLAGEVAVGAGIAAVVPTRLPEPLGWVLVVLVTVLLINGVNMLDGLDTLAAGVLAVAAGAAALLVSGPARLLSLAVCAGLVGFAVYNRPPARVYLGDGGSYFLGASLAVLLAWSWSPGVHPATSVAVLLLVAVPASEVAFAVVRRSRQPRSLMEGDRRHPYDLLMARGWGATRSVLAYVATEAVLCAVAIGAAKSGNLAGAVVAAAGAAVVLVFLAGACGTFRDTRSVGR